MQITSNFYYVLILSIVVNYCDQSVGGYAGAPTIHIGPGRTWNYFVDKPMKKVVIFSNNGYPSEDKDYVFKTELERNCDGGQPPLYCDNVEVSSTIYRSEAEPIKFTGTRFVQSARIRFPGVDGPIKVLHVEWNFGIEWKDTLRFAPQTREWTGTFPSMYIPIGNYQNTELIVEDGFGNKAKCKIGDISVIQ